MRFAARSLLGLVIIGLTLGLIVMAAGNIWRAAEEMAASEDRRRPAAERTFSAEVQTARSGSAEPVLTSFGEVAAARTLEVRAAQGGRIIALSPGFRAGGRVAQGDVLAQIDPADAQTAVDIASAALQEARAELAEASDALTFAEAEAALAAEQLALQEAVLARQEGLQSRGVAAEAAVETATISLSNARSSELSKRQAVASAKARISRAEIGVSRAGISLNEAQRTLDDTTITAPFAGVISDATAAEGRLVASGERLGEVIDANALEVAFRVSNAQYARLLGQSGRLEAMPAAVTLDLGGTPLSVTATLERTGAEVGDGQTGRQIFAALPPEAASFLQPGDFVRVAITEPQLSDVTTIPATAVSSAGRMLLLGADDRLEEISVEVLRRQGENAIVRGLTDGRDYVIALTPQLGEGIKVSPQRPGGGFVEREMVTLDPERRARLIAAIEDNKRMPSQVRDRLVGQLQREEVPKEVVDRIEARIGGGSAEGGSPSQGGGADAPGSGGPQMAIDDERRAKLVAFVEASDRMPADVKSRILTQLQSEQVPQALVDRLESRMGG